MTLRTTFLALPFCVDPQATAGPDCAHADVGCQLAHDEALAARAVAAVFPRHHHDAGNAGWLTNSYGLDVSPYVAIKTLTE